MRARSALDVRTFKPSPAEVAADAFIATPAGVTVTMQYTEHLAEQILAAAAMARAAA